MSNTTTLPASTRTRNARTPVKQDEIDNDVGMEGPTEEMEKENEIPQETTSDVQTIDSVSISQVSNIGELEKSIVNLKARNAELESKLAKLDYDSVKNSYRTIFGRLEPKLENASEIVKRSASLKTGKIRTTGEGDLKGLTPHEARLYVYASKVEASLFSLTKLLKDGPPKA